MALQSPAVRSAAQQCGKLITGDARKPPRASDIGAQLKFAQCMRAHGVAGYPDPTGNGAGAGHELPININPQSPAYQKAAKTCARG